MDVSVDVDAQDVWKLIRQQLELPRTAREFLEIRKDDSLLRQIPIQDITSKDVYDAAVKGDKLASEIFDYTGTILGEAFADFVAFQALKQLFFLVD